MTQASPTETKQTPFYRAVWRWHFYAGLYVVPFLLMSATTGLVMLYKPQIEAARYRDQIFVSPRDTRLPAQAQVNAVRAAYPDGTLTRYRPASAADRSSEVGIKDPRGAESTVYVNPYDARVLGSLSDEGRLALFAKRIHKNLLLGDLGDALIELAASLGIVLLATGLYMWWPGLSELTTALALSRANGRRAFWRGLHSTTGALISGVLLFYLVSGLAWTGVWGKRVVQAWSTFPAAKSKVAPDEHANHQSLNSAAEDIAPWALAQTPMPTSVPASADGSRDLTVDDAIRIAQGAGIGERYTVILPKGQGGVFTVAATTMSGDAIDPRDELTVHIDRRTGKVLARVGWRDYGMGARAMATGVPLHQGSFGGWNQIFSTVALLSIALLAVSGIAMWWSRRPKGALRLVAPSRPQEVRVPAMAGALLLTLCAAFPLAGLAIITILIVDVAVIQRVRWLHAIVN